MNCSGMSKRRIFYDKICDDLTLVWFYSWYQALILKLFQFNDWKKKYLKNKILINRISYYYILICYLILRFDYIKEYYLITDSNHWKYT